MRQMTVWQYLRTIIIFAVISASLFTMWTPANIFSNDIFTPLSITPTESVQMGIPTMEPNAGDKIGIIVGHRGYAPDGVPDPGAVCEADGLQEIQINLKVATLLEKELKDDGFVVELLDEADERLYGYEALALISLHSDTCAYLGPDASGFKLKPGPSKLHPEKAQRLSSCLINRYYEATGLNFIYASSEDMDEYHAFEKLDQNTPNVIMEMGFMLLDKDLLTNQTDKVVEGIANGIRCFAYNENIHQENE